MSVEVLLILGLCVLAIFISGSSYLKKRRGR
jgi:hypothetical protein